MIIGCYDLHLYCDNQKDDYKEDKLIHKYNEFPHRFTGHTEGQCFKKARANGWLIGKERQLCPRCSGKRVKDVDEATVRWSVFKRKMKEESNG